VDRRAGEPAKKRLLAFTHKGPRKYTTSPIGAELDSTKRRMPQSKVTEGPESRHPA